MDTFNSNNFDSQRTHNTRDNFQTSKPVNTHSNPRTSKPVDTQQSSEAVQIPKTPEVTNKTQEETKKKRRPYTKRKNAQSETTPNTAMKLFSVYAVRGWERVEGTLIAKTQDSVEDQAYRLLRVEDDEREEVTMVVNEIQTGIHIIR